MNSERTALVLPANVASTLLMVGLSRFVQVVHYPLFAQTGRDPFAHEAIAAAKAGIIGLTLSAAATYAERGIRVNCVAPGLVQTALTARLTANEASKKASVAMHPLGRLGEPAEVAGAIAWLLDSKQNWITGQVIGIDGGLATLRARVIP